AWAAIDAEKLTAAPPEVAMRLLQAVIGAFGGQPEAPDRSQVEALLERLTASGQKTMTLGGAVIRPGFRLKRDGGHSSVLAIYREPSRRPLPISHLAPGEGLYWDWRFYVSLSFEHREPVRVEPLGQAGYARLKRDYPSSRTLPIPAAAAAGLPSLWVGDRLLAVPFFWAA